MYLSLLSFAPLCRSWQHQRMWPVPGAPTARIHAGFFNMWARSGLKSNITAAIQALQQQHPTAGLFVAGHSMGGALAQLCAVDAKCQLGVEQVRSVGRKR